MKNEASALLIDQNIMPPIGASILKKSAAPRENSPVEELLPTASQALTCTQSSRFLELFQVYHRCLFGSELKITSYRC